MVKKIIYIGLPVLIIVSSAYIFFFKAEPLYRFENKAKPLYRFESVEAVMQRIKSEHELVSEFGNPHSVVRSGNTSEFQYIYYENDIEKIENDFVGFCVVFNAKALVIGWEPIYLSDLLAESEEGSEEKGSVP